MTEEAVYDKAERVVVGLKKKVTVSGVITPQDAGGANPNSVAGDLAALQAKLMQPARTLKYLDRSLGQVTVNDPADLNTKWDLAWGPKPLSFRASPLGVGNAVKFEWECEWFTVECTAVGGVMSWCYSWRVGHDEMGLSKRELIGSVEIPLTRRSEGARDVVATADYLKEQINPPELTGFKRTWDWQLSEDRRRADYTITDTEVPSQNALPPNVVSINAPHTLRSVAGSLFKKWQWILAASITVPPNYPTSRTADVFFGLLNQRLNYMRDYFRRVYGDKGFVGLPGDISISEDPFTLTVQYAFSMILVITTTREGAPVAIPNEIIVGSGLFLPTPTDWPTWAQSVYAEGGPYSPRSSAGLRYDPGSDALVDLCGGGPRLTNSQAVKNQTPQENDWIIRSPNLTCTMLEYHARTTAFVSNGKALHVPLSESVEPIEEKTHGDMTRYVYEGAALTINRLQRIPRVTHINGKRVIVVEDAVSSAETIGRIGDLPIVLTRWKVIYAQVDWQRESETEDDPRTLPPIPPNPIDNNAGTGGIPGPSGPCENSTPINKIPPRPPSPGKSFGDMLNDEQGGG